MFSKHGGGVHRRQAREIDGVAAIIIAYTKLCQDIGTDDAVDLRTIKRSGATRDFGYEPTTPISVGVPKCVAWYRILRLRLLGMFSSLSSPANMER